MLDCLPAVRWTNGSEGSAFSKGITIEAWAKKRSGGRLVDCITRGGGACFLLDTHPRDSLGLIVGRRMLLKSNGDRVRVP